jgi:hypothetical protein
MPRPLKLFSNCILYLALAACWFTVASYGQAIAPIMGRMPRSSFQSRT